MLLLTMLYNYYMTTYFFENFFIENASVQVSQNLFGLVFHLQIAHLIPINNIIIKIIMYKIL